MMRTVQLSMAVILITTFFSCSKDIKRADGDWDDNIHLSAHTAELKAAGDSVTFSTEGSWWWICDLSVDDKPYSGYAMLNVQTDSYKIIHDGFVVEKRDKHTLVIKADPNPVAYKRSITVGLEAGDFFDRISVTQKAR